METWSQVGTMKSDTHFWDSSIRKYILLNYMLAVSPRLHKNMAQIIYLLRRPSLQAVRQAA